MLTHTLNLCSAFTHPRCTYTAVNTHTHTHTHCENTPGAVGSQCCAARGAVGGSVPCSRVSPQSWYWECFLMRFQSKNWTGHLKNIVWLIPDPSLDIYFGMVALLQSMHQRQHKLCQNGLILQRIKDVLYTNKISPSWSSKLVTKLDI